ncbi:type VI secretion system lipoprotein TssJ [Pseudoxanthomonas mexicana]|uniref:type VI secretion system lipoprotein TssJ n=1 Tax=Pseudoxanthomonas mexicana TaxID=128785 RepID=UPI00398AD6BB
MLAALLPALLLGGCASDGALGRTVDRTLQMAGIKPAEPRARTIVVRLHAGTNLNAGSDNRANAAVIKLYRLRGTQRFEQAPFNAFLDAARERSALGEDLLGVEEVVLVPGARHEISQALPPEAAALGVVALFREPADNRWRLAFDARHARLDKEGITLGLHACAITTGSPALITRLAGDPASLVSTRCSKSPR